MTWFLLLHLTTTFTCPSKIPCPAPVVQTQQLGPYTQTMCERTLTEMRKVYGETVTEMQGISARTTARLACTSQEAS